MTTAFDFSATAIDGRPQSLDERSYYGTRPRPKTRFTGLRRAGLNTLWLFWPRWRP